MGLNNNWKKRRCKNCPHTEGRHIGLSGICNALGCNCRMPLYTTIKIDSADQLFRIADKWRDTGKIDIAAKTKKK